MTMTEARAWLSTQFDVLVVKYPRLVDIGEGQYVRANLPHVLKLAEWQIEAIERMDRS